MKEVANCNNLLYSNSLLRVSFTGSSVVNEFTPSNNIIEGWQRIEGSFYVPASATQIKVELVALNGVEANFDDVRVQPLTAA